MFYIAVSIVLYALITTGVHWYNSIQYYRMSRIIKRGVIDGQDGTRLSIIDPNIWKITKR